MAERSNGATADAPQAADTVSSVAEALDLKTRLDRFGEILTRGLDLAEASLSLGLTLATTAGSVARQKVERMAETVLEPAMPSPASPPAQSAPSSPQAPYAIVNRVPLSPGSPVSISFSINNDSSDVPKRVSLRVQGFAGDRPGGFLPLDSLSAEPAEMVIAPIDFEKFVLCGVIPPGVVPDTYRGSVLVESDVSMSIPVWITVQPRSPDDP